MLLGRFIGTLVAVLLMATFPTADLLVRLFLVIIFTTIGVIAGMISSVIIGARIPTDRPLPQDSLEYWEEKYGKELAEEYYRMWLDEF